MMKMRKKSSKKLMQNEVREKLNSYYSAGVSANERIKRQFLV